MADLLSDDQISQATEIACQCGFDFVKTSTGKIPGKGASIPAVEAILKVLSQRKKRGECVPGLKLSGGVTASSLDRYLALVSKHMGEAWLDPKTLRIGASQLLDELLALPPIPLTP